MIYRKEVKTGKWIKVIETDDKDLLKGMIDDNKENRRNKRKVKGWKEKKKLDKRE